jgi:hypothetical protein
MVRFRITAKAKESTRLRVKFSNRACVRLGLVFDLG